MNEDNCIFCDWKNPKKNKIILENDLFYSRWDNFPVSKGHAEVVPKRHINSIFDLQPEEILQMFDLLRKTKEIVEKEFHPNSFNVGENDGETAGRTVPHLHLHLIPRYKGDVENPRGGVRNIIPGKGDYIRFS